MNSNIILFGASILKLWIWELQNKNQMESMLFSSDNRTNGVRKEILEIHMTLKFSNMQSSFIKAK